MEVKSGGYLSTGKIIASAYTRRSFFHIFFLKFLQFYGMLSCRPLIICKQNILKLILSVFIAVVSREGSRDFVSQFLTWRDKQRSTCGKFNLYSYLYLYLPWEMIPSKGEPRNSLNSFVAGALPLTSKIVWG